MKREIAPSILSANFVDLKNDIEPIKDEISYIHLDVMDGHFVPNITLGPPVIKSIVKALSPMKKFIFDTHLMITNPEHYIKDFAQAGSDIIVIHQEATIHLDRTIQLIKSYGKKAGIALNPATPVDTIQHLLPQLDLVLIMSVNPGFGGQSFIPYTLEKVAKIKAWADQHNPNLLIQVDGGIKADNIKMVANAGANLFVAGSAVFGAEDSFKAVQALRG